MLDRRLAFDPIVVAAIGYALGISAGAGIAWPSTDRYAASGQKKNRPDEGRFLY